MFKEKLKIGKAVLVRGDKDMPITMDGSASPIRQADGSFRYFFTDLGDKPYYRAFKGDLCDPFKKADFTFDWDYNDYPKTWPCGLWAQSIYKCDDGMLIGFVHREDLDRKDKTYPINYHIGLGASIDGGHTWRYVGDICGTACNYIPLCHANMGGCPTIECNGYFITYFNEIYPDRSKRISAARFSVEETIAALKKGKLPKVAKYSGDGKWETAGIGGLGKEIVAPTVIDGVKLSLDSHSKATFCKPLGCYLMTFQTGGSGMLVMAFSKDGVNWNEYISADTVPEEHKGEYLQPYSCFVDASGEGRDDCFTVGGKFYLHCVRKQMKCYPYDEYYVREITVKK